MEEGKHRTVRETIFKSNIHSFTNTMRFRVPCSEKRNGQDTERRMLVPKYITWYSLCICNRFLMNVILSKLRDYEMKIIYKRLTNFSFIWLKIT